MQRFGCCFTVLHQRQANIAGAGIAAVGLPARQIASGHHAHAAVLVEFHRGRFVAALGRDVEPDAEAAGRPHIAVAIPEDLVGEIELDAVEPSIFLDMRLVAIGGNRDMLQRHRHLRGGDVAQLVEGGEKFPVAGGEADAHARQVRALRQRLERNDVGKIGSGAFEHAARRLPGVDFRIALVAQDHEAETIRKLLEAAEIFL